MRSTSTSKAARYLYMAGLTIAGESIYMLPYMRKTFQTSMEQVYGIDSVQVGILNTMFGILAIVCYLPSGYLADCFSARNLLIFSLVSTGLGGFAMMLIPGYPWLLAIHGFWGVTTILTFWPALVKATRDWGYQENQGLSFGLLDAGRGATGAVLASIATGVFAWGATLQTSLQGVLAVYAVSPMLAGGLIWLVVPRSVHEEEEGQGRSAPEHTYGIQDQLRGMWGIVQRSDVWLLAFVVFAAYTLYVGIYDLPAFVEKGYDKSKTYTATLGTVRDWMRPIGAIGAGLIADRFNGAKTLISLFALLILTFLSLYSLPAVPSAVGIVWVQVLLVGLAVFALRGVYFAMLEELNIPVSLTGFTVGFVSFVGFIPDLYMHLLSGYLVAYFEGVMGYHVYFAFLAVISVVGMASAAIILRQQQNAPAVVQEQSAAP